ncbi:MAG: SH3 domain-containing protein [Salinisphaeraceae bacterium]
MIGRAIFVILLNAIFLVGVLLYLPLDGLLEMRGYDRSHIQAMKDARAEDEELEAELAAEEEAEAAAADDADNEAMEALDPVADDAAADEETAEPGAEPPAREQLMATDVINVRSGPGTDNEQVGQLDAGETVTVLEDNGDDWIRIEFEDGEAWAYRPLFEQP